MIILSVGMPRAGSAWYYNLTNELALAAGYQDVHKIREQYHLQDILTEANCNIGALTTRRLLAVLVPSFLGNNFVVKAHAAPTSFARRLIENGQIKPAYIFRDPRDAMLSAIEIGQRTIQRGGSNAFAKLVDFDSSLKFILDQVRVWEAWMECKEALHTRYEDLLTNYDVEAARLVAHLGLNDQNAAIKAVVDKYRPEQARSGSPNVHFSKGKIGRFREKMTIEQQQILADRLGSFLLKMGYEI